MLLHRNCKICMKHNIVICSSVPSQDNLTHKPIKSLQRKLRMSCHGHKNVMVSTFSTWALPCSKGIHHIVLSKVSLQLYFYIAEELLVFVCYFFSVGKSKLTLLKHQSRTILQMNHQGCDRAESIVFCQVKLLCFSKGSDVALKREETKALVFSLEGLNGDYVQWWKYFKNSLK